MKKIIFQVSLILIIICCGMLSVFIQDVKADSIAGLNCNPSVDIGNKFTVSLILPANAYSAQANITIKYSNGTSASAKLVYMSGMNDFPNSVTLNAQISGKATVTASNIVISDASGNTLESGGSKVANITIVDKESENNNSNANSNTDNNNGGNSTTNPPATNSNNSNQNQPNNSNETVSFKDVNETVYTTERCNIRKSPSTSGDKVTTLDKAVSLKRTGTSSNGWSRVEYNGSTLYVSSTYLTTTKPVEEEVKFQDTNKKMYAIKDCNLRKSWSTSSDKVGALSKNEEVTVTGEASNGWSRLNYKGNVVYIASSLLSPKKIEDIENNIENNIVNNVETEEKIQEEVESQPQEEVVEENIEENTEEKKLAEIQSQIGVLPEVGNNISKILYYGMVLLSIAGIGVLVLLYKKIN